MEIWLVVIPAILSLGGAVYSAWSANRARVSEAETARLRELEQRLSDRKIELYDGILKTLGDQLRPEAMKRTQSPKAGQAEARLMNDLFGFMNGVVIYGSDDVLDAFSRFKRAGGVNLPGVIAIRLAADFMLAIRRDLSGGTTRLTAVDMFGMRITDFDTNPELKEALSEPFELVCAKYGWIPPWSPNFTNPPALEGGATQN
jgi:hypothetical protein